MRKRSFIAALAGVMMLTAASCGSADKVTDPAYAVVSADYADPHAAAAAVKAGIDIAGKTVVVKAMTPTKDNVIYDALDSDLSCHVKVTLTYNDKFEDPDLNGITEGTTVVITVEGTNDFLANSIYLFSSEFIVC